MKVNGFLLAQIRESVDSLCRVNVCTKQYINSEVVYSIANGKITFRVARFLVTLTFSLLLVHACMRIYCFLFF